MVRFLARRSSLEADVLRVAIVVIAGQLMSALDTTIVNIALSRVARSFHTTYGSVQWISTAYLLSLACVIPITGWSARRLGTRRRFPLSLTLFVVGSALCGAAWSLGSLIAFRVLQGLGGGMLIPTGQMILARAAGPSRMGRTMGLLGMTTVVAPAFGPTLG